MDYIFYMGTLCAVENEVGLYRANISTAMEAGLASRIKGAIVSFFKLIGGLFKRVATNVSSIITRIKNKLKKKKDDKKQPPIEVKNEDEAKSKIDELTQKAKDYESKIEELQNRIKEMSDTEEQRIKNLRDIYEKQIRKYEHDLVQTRSQRDNYKTALNTLASGTKITAENKDSLNSALADMMKQGSSTINIVLREARTLNNIKTMQDAMSHFRSRYFQAPDASNLDKFMEYVKVYADERKKIGKTDDKDINKMDIDVCMFFGENINRIRDCGSIYENVARIIEKIPDAEDFIVEKVDYDKAMRNMNLAQGFNSMAATAFSKAAMLVGESLQ